MSGPFAEEVRSIVALARELEHFDMIELHDGLRQLSTAAGLLRDDVGEWLEESALQARADAEVGRFAHGRSAT